MRMTPEEEQAMREAAAAEEAPSSSSTNNVNEDPQLPQTLITQGANNNSGNSAHGLPADLNMDDYDDDDDVGMLGDDTVYQAEDNYNALPEEAEEDDEEEEDTKIKDTDAILLATRTEDDFLAL